MNIDPVALDEGDVLDQEASHALSVVIDCATVAPQARVFDVNHSSGREFGLSLITREVRGQGSGSHGVELESRVRVHLLGLQNPSENSDSR